jgi:catechol 2,3-dioxygenase-like lactoylglutathione lyase family enzyme
LRFRRELRSPGTARAPAKRDRFAAFGYGRRAFLREDAMPDTMTPDAIAAKTTPHDAVRIRGLDHVVLRVADFDRAIAFYEAVLGCRVERRLDTPKLVQLRAGTALVDLMLAAPGSAPDPATERRNMDHFALRLDRFDAAAIAAHLARHGVACGDVQRRYGAEGYGPSIYITDPDGNTVELKGPPEPAG